MAVMTADPECFGVRVVGDGYGYGYGYGNGF